MNKTLFSVIGMMLGVSAAAAVHEWPEHATPIQMTLYSLAFVLILLPAFWDDRHHPRYVAAMSAALVIHVVILFFIRPLFPFKTILTVVPLLIVEAMILVGTIIKVRGERGLTPINDAVRSHGAANSHQEKERKHGRR